MNQMIDELVAKYEFWYVKKFIKFDVHYTFFLDLADTNKFAVKLLKKFPDAIVEYSNIKMSDGGELSFDFDVIANPKLHDVKSKKFIRFTQNVMRSIILGSIENYEKEKNENRNSDLVESDSERSVHEEISAVSEKRVPQRKPRKKTVRRNKAVHSEVQQSATDSSVGNQS